jgi:hypothetical protein
VADHHTAHPAAFESRAALIDSAVTVPIRLLVERLQSRVAPLAEFSDKEGVSVEFLVLVEKEVVC